MQPPSEHPSSFGSDVGSQRRGTHSGLQSELGQSYLEQGQPDGRDVERVKEQLETGTTTVGVTTADGVILAADTRASLGQMVSSKSAKKVYQVHPTAAITISGGVGAAQNLVKTLRAETNLYETRRGKDMSMQALSSLMANLLRTGGFLVTVPIMGGVDDEGPHVASFDAIGGVSEENYTATGTGTQYALGVLEQHYEEGMSMADARDVVEEAMESAMERDTASGNGLMVAEIDAEGVDLTTYEEYPE